jgi:hypothetical protein
MDNKATKYSVITALIGLISTILSIVVGNNESKKEAIIYNDYRTILDKDSTALEKANQELKEQIIKVAKLYDKILKLEKKNLKTSSSLLKLEEERKILQNKLETVDSCNINYTTIINQYYNINLTGDQIKEIESRNNQETKFKMGIWNKLGAYFKVGWKKITRFIGFNKRSFNNDESSELIKRHEKLKGVTFKIQEKVFSKLGMQMPEPIKDTLSIAGPKDSLGSEIEKILRSDSVISDITERPKGQSKEQLAEQIVNSRWEGFIKFKKKKERIFYDFDQFQCETNHFIKKEHKRGKSEKFRYTIDSLHYFNTCLNLYLERNNEVFARLKISPYSKTKNNKVTFVNTQLKGKNVHNEDGQDNEFSKVR